MDASIEQYCTGGSTVRAIITAAREHPGWNMYLGHHQHLIPIFGVPLLKRTVDQVLRRCDDVHLTVPPGDLGAEYVHALGDSGRHVMLHQNEEEGLCEYTSTRQWWNTNGPTVLLLGDVCFSTKAIEVILNTSRQVRDYRAFGRYRGSRITGYHAGELWGAAWHSSVNSKMDMLLQNVHDVRAAGAVRRPPGWMLLRLWQGTPLNKHRVVAPWFVPIDDTTEDFDYPLKWDNHPLGRAAKRNG